MNSLVKSLDGSLYVFKLRSGASALRTSSDYEAADANL